MTAPHRLVGGVRCHSSDEVLVAAVRGERRVELVGAWSLFTSCIGCSQWTSLKGISIVGCGLDDDDLHLLSSNLPSGLTAFGISGNSGLKLVTWQRLWKALPKSITELDLGFNKFEQDALTMLCESFLMPRGSSVSELRLDGNEFESLTPLRPALGAMPRLMKLDVSDNALTDDGLLPFVQSLSRASLRRVHLSRNTRISSQGASALFQILPRAENLEALHLDGTRVGETSIQVLQQRLANSSLQELDLRNAPISDAALQVLADAIPGSRLQKLYINKADFKEETISALAKAFSSEVHGSEEPERPLQELPNSPGAQIKSGQLSLSASVLVKAPKTWEARSFLQRQNYRQVPGHLKGIKSRLAQELEYVSKLGIMDNDKPRTRLVRLFTEEEKVALEKGLKIRLSQVQVQYEQDLAKASKSAYPGVKECVKKRYEPQLAQMVEDIRGLSQTYIFVDSATPRAV
eukprot:gnl/MRDRNA2_/MRDRNA2_59299_c0_seq1.p1 gnl/MRDRNA2_/MRDRNA2_59299_c0~~gnl/MRDRNA2_/MRDRNA2_59299_c0_seq1.p1  ORF type:complete len:463 (-),score=78.67 gnl/MRDRNA2_/MRDRNA2_59299_c0_seq1:36-1424(-)